MPKSKRTRLIPTSVVQKKSSAHRDALYTSIREAASSYTHILVLRVSNMRNTFLKDVRAQLGDSRLFFGKTKVMAKALGVTVDQEVLPGVSGLSEWLKGKVGVLFTNQAPGEVQEFLAGYTPEDFARAGTAATETFVLPKGVVYSRGGAIAEEDDVPVAHTQQANLQRFGLVTRLVKGKVEIDEDYVVAEEGKELDEKSAALLKTFGVTMATFSVSVVTRYDASKEEVVVVEGLAEDEDEA